MIALNDGQMQIDADGNYELVVSAQKRPGNWLRLELTPARRRRAPVSNETNAAADPLPKTPLTIELLEHPARRRA